MAKQALNLKYDILQIGQMASAAKFQNPQVVNGTIGVLYNDEGKIWSIASVDKTIKNLSDFDFYNYSPLDGGKPYKEAVKNWVFGQGRFDLEKELHVEVVATPGGTGALAMGIALSLDEHETLLLPDVYWSPYKGMAKGNNMEVIEYNYISDYHYNLTSFKEKAQTIITKQHKLVTILNDPCNNPTGFSLSSSEFKDLIAYLNSLPCPTTLILDIAYFDYYIKGMDEVRNRFRILNTISNNVTVIIAHSCSKSFSIYGLRVGSAIILNRNEQTVKTLYDEACIYGRTHWSSVSRPGINMLVKVNEDPKIKADITNELITIENTVKNRAAIFSKEAAEIGLDIHPYGGGFFISIKCEDATAIFEKLIQEGLYLIPFPHVLRMAICGITTKEIPGLAKRIKSCM